ncbi:MAG: hypothetical protein K9G44_05340 [Melioribacteraceae bacterium]|nr:hypothetical protein [Melioribacteraceae bacterium]
MNKFVSYCLALLYCPFLVCGQNQDLSFEHITTDNGLSQLVVESIVQDSTGFIWVGTQSGLNRYDSYEFKVYLEDPKDSNSLSDDYIRSLLVDSKNRLWIGTYGGGLNLLDEKRSKFVHYKNDPSDSNSIISNDVRTVFQDSQNLIWVGTNAGLELFDETSGTFKHFDFQLSNNFNELNNKIRTILEDSRNLFWVGTYGGGLFLFDRATQDYKQILFSPDKGNPSNNIWSLSEDSDGNIWCSTYGGGLNKITVLSQNGINSTIKIINYRNNPRDSKSISSNGVTSCVEDSEGNFWVGTDSEGLNHFNKSTEEFTVYRPDEFNPNSINNNSAWTLFVDKSGLLWVGTWGGGLNKLDKQKAQFKAITKNNGLKVPISMAVEVDKKGQLWVGTYGGGVSIFDKNNNLINNYDGNISLSGNAITALEIDSNDNIWIGTDGNGLNVFDPKMKSLLKYEHTENNSKSIPNNFIKTIYTDRKGAVWIGTLEGLSKFNDKNKDFITYKNIPDDTNSISHNAVRSIYQDINLNYWIGTFGGGLNKFNDKTGKFIHFRPSENKITGISSEKIRVIHEDKNGKLWIGTDGGGLNLFDPQTEEFSHFYASDGLGSNSVLAITEDSENNLWLTSGGIVRFNYNTKEVKLFTKSNGLLSNDYCHGAITYSNGSLYFGTVDGVQVINPLEISDWNYLPEIAISELKINNERKNPYVVIDDKNTIEVSYLDSFLYFEFATLDYLAKNRQSYRYRLFPSEEEWIDLGNMNFINFANLSPDKYTLEILGTNCEGDWIQNPYRLGIIVTPPFYQTFWFYALISLFISTIAYWIHRLNLARRIDLERLRLKIASDLHDDVGASLTQISLNADIINYEKNSEKIASRANFIREKSSSIIDSINDVIWSIDSRSDSLLNLCDRIQQVANNILESSDIRFEFQKEIQNENLKLNAEVKQNLFLICKEAINNALKYSKADKIRFHFHQSNKNLELHISDNGIGFEPEKVKRGNGLKNMKLRVETMKGKIDFKYSDGFHIIIQLKI